MVHQFPCGRALGSTNTRYPCPSTNLPTPKGCFAQDGSSSTPFGSGRVDRGCTWQGLLSLHLLLWPGGGALGKAFFPFTFFCGRGGGHLARPSFPSPSSVAPGGGGRSKARQSLLSLLLLLKHSSRRRRRKEVHLRITCGDKSEVATSPLPSRGPRRGRNCYVTPAFSGVPNAKRGDKIRSGYLTPAFLGATRGRDCYVTPAFSGVPNAKRGDKIRSGPQVGTSPTCMHFQ